MPSFSGNSINASVNITYLPAFENELLRRVNIDVPLVKHYHFIIFSKTRQQINIKV